MSFRIQRAQSAIMEEISLIVQKEIRDPRIKNVTITGTKVSPDLKNATIFFSVLGNDDEIKQAQDGLDHAIGFLRREIGRKLQMKFTPNLRFQYDDTLKKAAHITELLEKIKHHEPEHD